MNKTILVYLSHFYKIKYKKKQRKKSMLIKFLTAIAIFHYSLQENSKCY